MVVSTLEFLQTDLVKDVCRREHVPLGCNVEEQQNHVTQSPVSSIVEDPQNRATETPVTETIRELDQQNNAMLERLPEQGESSVQLQQQGPLKRNDVTEYTVGENDEWTRVSVLSRAGKAKTATKHWYTVQDISGACKSLHLEPVSDWRKITSEEEVNIVMIPKDKQNNQACIKAKADELQQLLDFDVYMEVDDKGQDSNSTTWSLRRTENK